MPVHANKAAWRLLAACAIANAVCVLTSANAQTTTTQTDALPRAETDERQDSFYCAERRLGYWFYCNRPKPPEQKAPAPAASATSQLDAITATLRELKAKAILEPTPANVTAYIRFQRAQLDRASLFSDVWQRAIWQDPELDYTLQRPVSTLGKRQWQDSRSAERNAAMAQLSERYGLFTSSPRAAAPARSCRRSYRVLPRPGISLSARFRPTAAHRGISRITRSRPTSAPAWAWSPRLRQLSCSGMP